MAEEYLLIKKTTYDRMKRNERVETHDQSVNTEENDPRDDDALSTECPPQTPTHSLDGMSTTSQNPMNQSGSGLTYAAKRKSTSPLAFALPREEKIRGSNFEHFCY